MVLGLDPQTVFKSLGVATRLKAAPSSRGRMDTVLRGWFAKPQGVCVSRAYAFNLSSTTSGWHEPLRFDPATWAGAGWEAEVARQAGFDDARVELRLVDCGRKRRVLLYPGDLLDPAFPPPPRKVVINARLLPRPGVPGVRGMDVTKRVQKYVGNDLRTVHDMFPFDDHEDNTERFSHVRVIDLAMTVTDVPLASPALSQ